MSGSGACARGGRGEGGEESQAAGGGLILSPRSFVAGEEGVRSGRGGIVDEEEGEGEGEDGWTSEMGMTEELDVPWACPRRELLPTHVLSQVYTYKYIHTYIYPPVYRRELPPTHVLSQVCRSI